MFKGKKAGSSSSASAAKAPGRTPSVADVQIRLVATRDYAPPPNQPQALPLRRGKEYILVSRTTMEWHTVREADTGRSGLSPSDALASIDSPQAREAQAYLACAAAGIPHSQGYGQIYVALYDFQTTDGGLEQMPLKAGARYTLVQSDASGWWTVCQADGSGQGLVPGSYLTTQAIYDAMQLPEYHAGATDADIQTALAEAKPGTYLLRDDPARPGQLMLSMKTAKEIASVAILQRPDGSVHLQGDSAMKPSVPELIKYYTVYKVKEGWGKLKEPCFFRTVRAVTQGPNSTLPKDEVEALINHVDFCINTVQSQAKDGALSDPLRQHVAILSNARRVLQAGKALDGRTAQFVDNYNPNRPDLMEQQPLPNENPASGAVPVRPAPSSPQMLKASRSAPPPPARVAPLAPSAETARQRTPAAPAPPPPERAANAPRAAPAPPLAPVAVAVPTPAPPVAEAQATPEPDVVPAKPPRTSVSRADQLALAPTVSSPEPSAAFTEPAPDITTVLSSIHDSVVQKVREETGATFQQSRLAVLTVLSLLWEPIAAASTAAANAVAKTVMQPIDIADSDAQQLHELFEALTAMVRDTQQRNWAVQDDEATISTMLKSFCIILEQGNPAVAKGLLQSWTSPGQAGEYEIVNTLVSYFQMETRAQLRLSVLELLGTLATTDEHVVPVLRHSVLPIELSRDITAPEPWAADRVKLIYYALLLSTIMFAEPEALAVEHYSLLGTDYITALLDMIEHKCISNDELQISEQALALLLAFNQHFGTAASEGVHNVVMETLASRPSGVIGERVLLLFNRNTDPVAASIKRSPDTHVSLQRHSVVKFLHDVFSSATTAQSVVFEADLRLMIELIQRELVNHEPGSEARINLLKLLGTVLNIAKNSLELSLDAPIYTTLTHIRDEDVEVVTTTVQEAKSLAETILNDYFSTSV